MVAWCTLALVPTSRKVLKVTFCCRNKPRHHPSKSYVLESEECQATHEGFQAIVEKQEVLSVLPVFLKSLATVFFPEIMF